MKLTELNPRWVTFAGNSVTNGKILTGLSFICPHCINDKFACNPPQRLNILFKPAIDTTPERWTEKINVHPLDQKIWTRTKGDDFETITLEPSLDFSDRGHWHGAITDGNISFS